MARIKTKKLVLPATLSSRYLEKKEKPDERTEQPSVNNPELAGKYSAVIKEEVARSVYEELPSQNQAPPVYDLSSAIPGDIPGPANAAPVNDLSNTQAMGTTQTPQIEIPVPQIEIPTPEPVEATTDSVAAAESVKNEEVIFPTAAGVSVGPIEVVPTTPPTSPAGWYQDPTNRHELRYYDGNTWTAHVSDSGNVTSDPLT
jgi:hypothetical protein